MRFFDVRSPFFAPLWRRIVICAVIGGWALLELVGGNPGWALIFGAAGAWLTWSLLIDWRLPDDKEDKS